MRLNCPGNETFSVLFFDRGTYNVGSGTDAGCRFGYGVQRQHVILYRLAEQDRKLDAIHVQAVITNRCVSKLEKWQSFIEGGLAVLAILVVPS